MPKPATDSSCSFAWDFDRALLRARTLVATPEEEPDVNPNMGTMEFALRDPDGYYVMVSALSAS